MDAFMAMMNSCRDKAKQTHEGLCTSNPLTGVYAFGPVPESHCFRINLIGATDAHGFTAVSVSHPPDVGPSMYEIALVGAGGGLVYIDRLGMGDIHRFCSLGELVDGLVRLANNLPVYDDDE